MPFTVDDNLDPNSLPPGTNIRQAINILATQIKELSGKQTWRTKPDYSIVTAIKGDTGATGAAGAKGDKGDPGATGSAGAVGAKGDKGDPGATGATPSLAPEAWQDLTLATNWSQSSGSTAQYRKLLGSLIEVKGLITKSSALAAGEVVATLPSGFRPTQTRYFICYGSNSYSRIQLEPSGQIKVTIAGSNFSAGLDFMFGLG